MKATEVKFPEHTPKHRNVSNQCKKFIQECLEFDHRKRLSSQQAFDHPYLEMK